MVFGGGNAVNVRITGDASQLKRTTGQAEKDVQSFTGKTKSTLSKWSGVIKGLLIAGAAKAIMDFAGDAIQAASDLEQAIGGTEAVFGTSAKAIEDFAVRSAEAIGLSETEFRTATTLIGGQLKRMTGDVDFAAEQSIILAETGADLAATYGGTTKEAVEALSSAFRGEADPAERFNLNLKAGVVNAKAVEMGLAETTGKVDDYARSQAILALIAEQSADAQGQFAREADTAAGKAQRLGAATENVKAQTGAALQPAQALGQEFGLTLAKGAGILATAFGELTGRISPADAAIKKFEISTGASKDTGAAAVTMMLEYGVAAEELVPKLGLSREEIIKLQGADEELLEEMGLSEEQVKDLAGALDDELVTATYAERDAALQARPEVKKFGDEMEEVEEDTLSATEAIQAQIDKLRAMSDPFFGAIEAAEDLEQAQRDYKTAVDEGDLEGQEDAIRDIAAANIDLREKFQELKEQGIDPASDAGKNAFRDMGLTEEQIALILGQFQEIEDNAPTVPIRVKIPDIESRTTAGGDLRWEKGEVNTFHRGGTFRAPTPGGEGLAVLQDKEEIIPADRANQPGMGGAARDVSFTLSDGSQMGAQEMIEALTTWQRRNGPLPLQVSG